MTDERKKKMGREKKIFTLIEFLMMKFHKRRISFRQQDRAQSIPALPRFFTRLLNCSNVRLFHCFSIFSFRIPCSIFLLRRMKTRIFTLIELLIVIAIIAMTMRSSMRVKILVFILRMKNIGPGTRKEEVEKHRNNRTLEKKLICLDKFTFFARSSANQDINLK